MDIKEIVKVNQVRFAKYRQGYAYYTVRVPSKGIDYMFPVSLSDIGDATLHATDKALAGPDDDLDWGASHLSC